MKLSPQVFDLVCRYSRLSATEREHAWQHAHYRPGSARTGAIRAYAAIARSLSIEERIVAFRADLSGR